jgi:hypothetical protein
MNDLHEHERLAVTAKEMALAVQEGRGSDYAKELIRRTGHANLRALCQDGIASTKQDFIGACALSLAGFDMVWRDQSLAQAVFDAVLPFVSADMIRQADLRVSIRAAIFEWLYG